MDIFENCAEIDGALTYFYTADLLKDVAAITFMLARPDNISATVIFAGYASRFDTKAFDPFYARTIYACDEKFLRNSYPGGDIKGQDVVSLLSITASRQEASKFCEFYDSYSYHMARLVSLHKRNFSAFFVPASEAPNILIPEFLKTNGLGKSIDNLPACLASFHFTRAQQNILQKYLDALRHRDPHNFEHTLASLCIDALEFSHQNKKQLATKLLQILHYSLYPEEAETRASLTNMLSTISSDNIRASYDENLESAEIQLHVRIHNKQDLAKMQTKLQNFDFSAWEKEFEKIGLKH